MLDTAVADGVPHVTDHFIKRVAGALHCKPAVELAPHTHGELSAREPRPAGGALHPQGLRGELGVGSWSLQRRLAEHDAGLHLERSGRSRFRLMATRSLQLLDGGDAAP